MSFHSNPFGQSYNSQSVFGQARDANTSVFGPSLFGTGGSTVLFGTTTGFSQAKPSLFGSAPTSGTSTASVFGASGRSDNIFGSPPVFRQSTNSTSNLFVFVSQIAEPKTGGTSNDCFGKNIGSNSFFGTTGSAVSGGSAAPFPVTSGTSFASTSPSFRGTTGFGFSNQCTGSRRAAYSATKDENNEKLQSLSGMPVYSGKSHEELRLEDYNAGDRGGMVNGGSSPWAQTSRPLDSKPSFSTLDPQTSSNPFFTQTTSGLFSTQTSPGFFSTKPTFNSNPPQTSSTFSSQTSLGQFSNQTTPSFFPSQTSTNPLAHDGPLVPQPSFHPGQPQTFSNGFSHLNSSSLISPQTSSLFSPQTSSLFSPQSSSSGFSAQTSSSLFFPQTSPGFFSTHTTSNSNPPQTSSSFSFQTSFSPFSNQTTPSFFTPQTSSNGFSTLASLSPFSHQTSPHLLPHQIPTTTFASTTSSFTFMVPSGPIAPKTSSTAFSPTISPSTFIPCPTTSGASVSGALPVSNNFKTLSNPVPGLNSSATPVSQFNSSPFVAPSLSVSTSNVDACAQIPFLPTPWHSAQTVQTTSPWPSAEVIGPSLSSQGTPSQSTVVGQPVVNPSPFGELPAMTRLAISQPRSTISVQYGISSMPVRDKPIAPVRLSSSLTSWHLSHHRMRLPARKYGSKSDGPKVPFFSKDEEKPSMRASTLVPRENPRAFVVLSAELWPHGSETEEISPGINASLHGNEYGVSSENDTKKEPSNALNVNLMVYEPDPPETKVSEEHMDEIGALMPQLSLPDYYSEPPIKQLAEKEMAEPGFCSRVNDFVIGHRGYGSIKFLGETDVRRLCLDSLVEFDNREVVVYKNENEKPPVGKGLNKLAEVTLLNIQCIDKKTGKKYVDGPKVEKYKDMLIKKGEGQGVEFISYDPVKGEWKFRVQHF